MSDLVLDKVSLSEYNTEAGQVVDSEKVETELGTLTVKEVDSKKAKAALGTCSQKVVDSVKVKAGLGTLTGAKAAELRIVVDLTRVEPGMAKAGPGDPRTWKPRKRCSYSCGQPYLKLCKRYCKSICTNAKLLVIFLASGCRRCKHIFAS